ncbi:TPA: IS1 family transposase [Candidatus Woesearchaeota archaeon]|nr:IS1 family transposase [Candidatus Woesearchaeota archaeon]HIH31660.1 IS1 family transposase [Candidatus Woesearchaeota archaeon]HIH54822.1 IS1 family transposase [Candidatus Woesearchaeota archaeon]HIJ02134.1 IS1 family transposase [Candidatus Woesearchaeota archaeon]HIJ13659.1 IS1 family transposase [Candidatus Woesearchaeota archaeon]
MARPKTHNKAVCQNNNCSFYRKETGKDITKQGKNYAGHQRFLCKHCNKSFAETKGTPLYQKKLSERKIKEICKELVQKKGIRATGRALHVNRNTICNLLEDLANHTMQMTNYLVHDLDLKAYEVDEILTFVKKNKKNLSQKQISSLNQARQQLQHA